MQLLYSDTMAALQELLKSVLAKDSTPDGLQNVFKVRFDVGSNEIHRQINILLPDVHVFIK